MVNDSLIEDLIAYHRRRADDLAYGLDFRERRSDEGGVMRRRSTDVFQPATEAEERAVEERWHSELALFPATSLASDPKTSSSRGSWWARLFGRRP